MVSFCIKNNNEKIINYLYENISAINLDNIIFSKKDFSKYTNIIIHYNGKNISEFNNELSNVIRDCIIKFYEPQIIKQLIILNYFYFDSSDISKIEENCLNILNYDCCESSSSIHFSAYPNSSDYKDRKICLWIDILKYVTENKSMILDGFVRFRIPKYINYIDSCVDDAVNQFVIDKEYFDFINLLKLYISSKSPLCDLVHLIYINGESILLDKDKQIISLSKSSLNVNYLSDITFSSNDYALNTVLSLLPSKIILHLITPEDEFINTLKLIFDDNIQICKDCNICKTYQLLNSGTKHISTTK